jgi:hypothetical protein
MATFGERVKELRKEKGQTMREVVDVITQKNAPANSKESTGANRGVYIKLQTEKRAESLELRCIFEGYPHICGFIDSPPIVTDFKDIYDCILTETSDFAVFSRSPCTHPEG